MSISALHAHCEVHFLGKIPYLEAWELQNRMAAEIANGQRPPTLLLLEHPHTYTFGRKGQAEHLLWQPDTLVEKQIEIHWVDRGGDVTYHGPGQLVGYPLLPLAPLGWQTNPAASETHLPQADYVGYIRKLEEVIIRTLASFGIISGQLAGLTGVWVQPDVASRCAHCPPAARTTPAKIASIGIKVDARGVTRHGFAINVHPEMDYWDGIVGCGLKDTPAISMAELLPSPPDLYTAASRLIPIFGKVFDILPVEKSDGT